MESIEQMIKRLCPKGVEWKKICEICMNCDSKRKPVTSGKRVAGKYPYYGASGIVDYVEDYIFDGDYLLVSEDGANLLARRTPIAFSISGKNWVNNHAHVLQFDNYIERKYIEYYLNMIDLRKYISGGAQPKLSQQSLNNIFVPVPPLEIQSRIVEVLDKMTTLTAELEAELKAELEARKQQYEYYRNKLLTFSEIGGDRQVAWKKISEICTNICSGGTPPRDKSDYFIGNIPWLRTQEVNWTEIYDTELKISEEAVKNSSAKIIPSNCVIVAMYGATAAKACINKIELTTNQACCNLQIDSGKALYKYVYYWICNNYIKLKCLGEGSQNNLNAKKIKDFIIPIPPLSEQQRIVSILDRFEALTTDLQSGLPAEIEARRQQYEYYRNKLLTFDAV